VLIILIRSIEASKATTGSIEINNRLIAEFLGSAVLVIAAISPTILAYNVLRASASLAVLYDSLAVAFVLIALIEILGPVSGCHINPAITIAMILTKEMDFRMGVRYIVVQMLGGLVGVISSHLMFYDRYPILLTISCIERAGGCYYSEFFGTFLLILTIYGCKRNNSKLNSLIIGLLVGGLLLATSSTMFTNPQVTFARMFTYAIAGIRPIDALFFFAFEMLGALVASAVSIRLFLEKKYNAQT